MSTEVAHIVDVRIDADRINAWVTPARAVTGDQITAEGVRAALEVVKIPINDAVAAKVEAFVAECGGEGDLPERFLIAAGKAPVEGKHGDFKPVEPEAPEEPTESDEDQIDYRALNFIQTVEEGTVIGYIIPPVPGKRGVDVHGNALAPQLRIQEVRLGPNVRTSPDDPTVAVAAAAGRVVFRGGRLDIDDVLYIKGDVDLESGNVDAVSDVNVRGTVRDLFKVKSKKSVTVGGAVECAEIEAGDDVVIHGGIVGRFKGRVDAAGCILTKFCSEAHLCAGGDITLGKEAIHCELRSDGKIVVERGDIVGGKVYAREGIEVRSLGGDAGTKTEITVGIDPDVLRASRQADAFVTQQLEAVEQIREKVQPLMANLKRLTPAQKEQATELLFKADEMELEINNKREQQKQMIADASPKRDARVVVNKLIYPGVRISIGTRETRFSQEMRGPVRIELRKVKNVSELIAVNPLTGSTTRLSSMRIDLSPPKEPAKKEGDAEATDGSKAS